MRPRIRVLFLVVIGLHGMTGNKISYFMVKLVQPSAFTTHVQRKHMQNSEILDRPLYDPAIIFYTSGLFTLVAKRQ